MLPELGKYAGAVLSSYAVSIALIAGADRGQRAGARRVKRDLDEVEKRGRGNGAR